MSNYPATNLGLLASRFNLVAREVMTRSRYFHSSVAVDNPQNLLPVEVYKGTPQHNWGGTGPTSVPIRFEAVPTHVSLHLNADIQLNSDYDSTASQDTYTVYTTSDYSWYYLLRRLKLEGTGAPAGYTSIDGASAGFVQIRKLYRISAIPGGADVLGSAGTNRISEPTGTATNLVLHNTSNSAPISTLTHLRFTWIVPISISTSVLQGAPRFDGSGSWMLAPEWAPMLGTNLGPYGGSPIARTDFTLGGSGATLVQGDPFALFNVNVQVDVYGYTLPVIPQTGQTVAADNILTPDQASALYGQYLVCQSVAAQPVQTLTPWQASLPAGFVLVDLDMQFYDNQSNRTFLTYTPAGGYAQLSGSPVPFGNAFPDELLTDQGPVTFQAGGGNIQPLKIDGRGLNTEQAWRVGYDTGNGFLAIWSGQPGGMQGVPYPALNCADLGRADYMTLQIPIGATTLANGLYYSRYHGVGTVPVPYQTDTSNTFVIPQERYLVLPGVTKTGS